MTPFMLMDLHTTTASLHDYLTGNGASTRVKVYISNIRQQGMIKCAMCAKRATHFSVCENNNPGEVSIVPYNIETETLFSLDHILPYSLLGSGSRHNLQAMCVRCNRRKSNDIDLHLERRLLHNDGFKRLWALKYAAANQQIKQSRINNFNEWMHKMSSKYNFKTTKFRGTLIPVTPLNLLTN